MIECPKCKKTELIQEIRGDYFLGCGKTETYYVCVSCGKGWTVGDLIRLLEKTQNK